MKKMLVLVLMVAVLAIIFPQPVQGQVWSDSVITDSLEVIDIFSCCCLSSSHIHEYEACVWAEMEIHWPLSPYATPFDLRHYSLYLTACSNFPVASFSISLEYYEGLIFEGVTWLDPLDEWDGVHCDVSNLAERKLRFLGCHDLDSTDNQYFRSWRPHRLIRVDFTCVRPILFPHWPMPQWPVRFLNDELTGLPAFGDTTGLIWFEVRTFNSYGPRGPKEVVEVESELPTELALQQNYPNPFNAVTVIRFALPEASNVVIEVYDVLGRRVDGLYSGFKPAGNHTVHWRADQVSSGVYFYRIQAGSFTASRKMNVVK